MKVPSSLPWLTIGRSFMLWLLGVVVLTLILVSGLALSHQQRFLEEELVTGWRMRARLLAVAVAEGGEPEHLPVPTMGDLRSLEVYDGGGGLMWRYGPTPDEVMALDDSVLRISESVPVARRGRGTVEVVILVSRSRIRHHLISSVGRLLVGLSVALGVALVVGAALVGWIARPIRELADRVRDFDPELPLTPVQARSASAEVAELAEAFLHMAQRLGEQRRSLIASERRFRALVASSPTPLLELDGRLAVHDANPAAAPFLGCEAEEARGLPVERYLHGASAGGLLRRVQAAGEEVEVAVDGSWRLPGGEIAEVDLRLRPLGHGYLMAIHDLTDRVRRMGERWRRTFDAMADGVALVGPSGDVVLSNHALTPWLEAVRDHLRRQPETCEWQMQRDDRLLHCTVNAPQGLRHRILVVRDNTDTARAQSRLREAEKMEAVGTLAGGVAHDFNNLLAGVLLHVRWLQRNPEALNEAADAIQDLAEEGVEVVRELLLFARRESTPHRGLDMARLLRESEGVLRHLLPDTIDLEVRVVGGSLPVVGNPVALRRLVLNLVLNARDAVTESGGRIEVLVEEEDDRVVLAVSDDGVGIAAEHRGRLFEPFFSLRREGRGAGLGLAVVYSIVTEHGGRVWVDSEEGRGTRITVTLDLDREAEIATDASEAEEIRRDLPGRVLLVEDDGKLAARLVEELVAVGLDVRHAPSVQVAREIVAHWQPDAVIADLAAGESALNEWLQALDRPVVVLTGSPQRTAVDLGDGVRYELLSRPASPEQLLVALRRVAGGGET